MDGGDGDGAEGEAGEVSSHATLELQIRTQGELACAGLCWPGLARPGLACAGLALAAGSMPWRAASCFGVKRVVVDGWRGMGALHCPFRCALYCCSHLAGRCLAPLFFFCRACCSQA